MSKSLQEGTSAKPALEVILLDDIRQIDNLSLHFLSRNYSTIVNSAYIKLIQLELKIFNINFLLIKFILKFYLKIRNDEISQIPPLSVL